MPPSQFEALCQEDQDRMLCHQDAKFLRKRQAHEKAVEDQKKSKVKAQHKQRAQARIPKVARRMPTLNKRRRRS